MELHDIEEHYGIVATDKQIELEFENNEVTVPKDTDFIFHPLDPKDSKYTLAIHQSLYILDHLYLKLFTDTILNYNMHGNYFIANDRVILNHGMVYLLYIYLCIDLLYR